MKFTQLFTISFQSILNNKLRTSLTVLGVVVGIFSIIVIMTIITMLQNSIEGGLSLLNKIEGLILEGNSLLYDFREIHLEEENKEALIDLEDALDELNKLKNKKEAQLEDLEAMVETSETLVKRLNDIKGHQRIEDETNDEVIEEYIDEDILENEDNNDQIKQEDLDILEE